MNFIVLKKKCATEPLNDAVSFIAVKKNIFFFPSAEKRKMSPDGTSFVFFF